MDRHGITVDLQRCQCPIVLDVLRENPCSFCIQVVLGQIELFDATVGLDNSGNVSVSGTFSGVTISHTIKNGADKTVGSASIAGMDITLTNDAGATDWKIGTTVSGVAVTLNSDKAVTAVFGLAGNTMTVAHTAERAAADAKSGSANGDGANGYGTNKVNSKASFTTVAISRSLTSGATLAANVTGGGGGATTADGAANTGGGGRADGGAGGSGVVILRYPNTFTISQTGLTLSTATDGSDSVTTITAGTGTVSWS